MCSLCGDGWCVFDFYGYGKNQRIAHRRELAPLGRADRVEQKLASKREGDFLSKQESPYANQRVVSYLGS